MTKFGKDYTEQNRGWNCINIWTLCGLRGCTGQFCLDYTCERDTMDQEQDEAAKSFTRDPQEYVVVVL